MRTVVKTLFVSAPCRLGQKKIGTDMNSEYLPYRYNAVVNINNSEGYQKLYDKIKTYDLSYNKLVTFGGDHSIATATIAAINDNTKNNLAVIWIDAHADINTFATSTSQNIHGMPVAFLLGLCHQNFVNMQKKLKPSQIIYVGLRDVDNPEWKFINSLNITYYTVQDIRDKGINKCIKEIQKIIGQSSVHISLDVDALDPLYCPSTGTKSNNGLDLEDVVKLIRDISRSNKTRSIDIAEFNPLIGSLKDVNTTINSIHKCVNAFHVNANERYT